jgi:hypothetical protein
MYMSMKDCVGAADCELDVVIADGTGQSQALETKYSNTQTEPELRHHLTLGNTFDRVSGP